MEKQKHIIEAELKPNEMETEDGGQFGFFQVSQNDEEENGIYVRFCSWDDTCKHEEFSQYIGRKVKITIETIDDND